jgi:mono/diheme cytochrome c family protein
MPSLSPLPELTPSARAESAWLLSLCLGLCALLIGCGADEDGGRLASPDGGTSGTSGSASGADGADPDADALMDPDGGTSGSASGADGVDVRRGEAWYRDYCASCHGGFGEGISAPKLRGWSKGEQPLIDAIDALMPLADPSLCQGECAVEVARYILSWSAALDCSQPAPLPPARLRLLNPREYNNTVRDLLGVQVDCDAQGCTDVASAPTAGGDGTCRLHTFAFKPSGGQAPQGVHVAGSFNGWAATVAAGGWPMTWDAASGEWRLERDLPEGEHTYKFVLDERDWVQDTSNPDAISDGFGGFNSRLNITCDTTGGACAPQAWTFTEGAQRPQTVHVAGNFNQWAATIAGGGWPLARQSDGRWTLSRALPAGTYQYKLVLDERDWLQDTTNPQSASDGLGGLNSVLTVACDGSATFWEDPTADFPPALRPQGFGFDTHAAANVVTAAHVEAYMEAAASLSQLALATADQWLPCHQGGGEGCAQTFAREWGGRAFRRPLTDAEVSRYAALVMAEGDFHGGLSVALQVMLSSPRFLYRAELGVPQPDGTLALTPYEVASALSYTFWATTPDAALLAAAASGALASPAEVEVQARRLLNHPRARDILGDFAAQWLGVERVLTADKKPDLFPSFTPAVRAAALAETRRFVSHVAFDSSGRYDELLTADYAFANQTLAPLYGLTTASPTPAPLPDPSGRRAGLLGHASVMAAYAHSDQTSPIKRGLFVRQHLLCQDFPPPPANAGGVPEVDPTATTRERFRQHSDNPTCYACHQYIDGVGFGFERLDPIGQWRDTEQGQPIDAHGDLKDVEGFGSGTPGNYDGLPALAALLTDSSAAPACFAKQYHRFTMGALDLTADACTLAALLTTFEANDRRIIDLMVAVTQLPAFTRRSP